MKSCTLELGACRTFRQYVGGRFTRTREGVPAGKVRIQHVPARYENVELPDSIFDGLKALADKWHSANDRKAKADGSPDPDGLIGRMVRISDVKDVGPDPMPGQLNAGTAQLEQVVTRAVVAAIKPLIKELVAELRK